MIILDNRETDLIKLVKSEVKQLPVGDIWIGIDEKNEIYEGGIIIERKSIRDLEASILDGRYREQRGRILSYCEQNKTNPMYILEGNFNESTGRLQKKALIKFVNRLILHYGIPIVQTSSLKETAEYIEYILEQWKEDPKKLQRRTEMIKVTDGIHINKKSNTSDHRNYTICCLAQCPGVSVKIAEALIDNFKSLKGVMEADVKTIENIKIGSRRIGPVVSKRLYNLLNNVTE
jgi:ERCC4-type nuclease